MEGCHRYILPQKSSLQFGFMLWCFLCLRYLVGESITLRYQALGKLILSIYILRDNTGMIDNQKSLLHILIRCTPDWHSEDMNMSYVFTIWVLGFAIPTLFIVVTSVVTCAKMQQVIQKSFLILLQKLIFNYKNISYT